MGKGFILQATKELKQNNNDEGEEEEETSLSISSRLSFFFLSLSLSLFFFFRLHCVSCGILVPQPGVEPTPLVVKAQSPNPWIAREFPHS